MKLCMFRTVPQSIIRSFSLYTQKWYMSYRFADSMPAGSGWNCVPSWSCSQAVSKPVWHIPFLCVQWKTPDDGQRNCPKHAEFHSKNKFEKLVHLVGFYYKKQCICWLWQVCELKEDITFPGPSLNVMNNNRLTAIRWTKMRGPLICSKLQWQRTMPCLPSRENARVEFWRESSSKNVSL
jgi:hypothetical protein